MVLTQQVELRCQTRKSVGLPAGPNLIHNPLAGVGDGFAVISGQDIVYGVASECGRYKRGAIGSLCDGRWASGNESEVDSRPSPMDIKRWREEKEKKRGCDKREY